MDPTNTYMYLYYTVSLLGKLHVVSWHFIKVHMYSVTIPYPQIPLFKKFWKLEVFFMSLQKTHWTVELTQNWKSFFIPHSVNIHKSYCGNIDVFDYRVCTRPLRVSIQSMVNASYFSKIQQSQNSQICHLRSFWIIDCGPVVGCLGRVAWQAKRQGWC